MRQGSSVTVLERGSAGQESSWAGGGILSPLCPWDYPDEVNRLALRSAALFGDWVEGLRQTTGIDPEYQRCGMLVLQPFDAQVARQWCAAHRVSFESLVLTDGMFPHPNPLPAGEGVITPSSLGSNACLPSPVGRGRACEGAEGEGEALFLPDIAQVRNPRLLQALRARVVQLGGRIVGQCEVKEIVTEAGRVKYLATTQGDFSADTYIVTAGAWSKVLLGGHALHADIKPIRGQMLLFKFEVPPLPHIVLQKDLYLIPRRDGHLLAGSTLEDVGFDKSTTDEARAMLLQRAVALLPALHDMPIVKHWAGLRPGSPKNIPTIGRHPRLQNLYINSGHFRYGITMAPASAEVLLNELNGTTQPFDVSAYRWR